MPPSALHQILHQDPNFGWDPWIGPGKPQTDLSLEEFLAVQSQTLHVGADAIAGDIDLFPLGLDYYGSYVDNYGGWAELQAWAAIHAPNALLMSYTIFGDPALCADVEQGAMVNSDLLPGRWPDTKAWRDAQGKFWVYTSASNFSALNQSIGNRTDVVRIAAHYGFGPHICGPGTCGWPQADWTQWDDKGSLGQNIDRLIGTYLPSAQPTPPPPAPKGSEMIAVTTNADGRQEAFSVLQSGEVKHIWQTVANGSWNGKAGVTPYYWADLGNTGGTPVGISAGRNQDGRLEVFVKLADGSCVHCWQDSAGGSWNGSKPGVNASWQSFGSPGQ